MFARVVTKTVCLFKINTILEFDSGGLNENEKKDKEIPRKIKRLRTLSPLVVGSLWNQIYFKLRIQNSSLIFLGIFSLGGGGAYPQKYVKILAKC